MTPPLKQTRGFTLIELLVVIAIIGILAGFLAIGLPRALEAAKIAKVENTFLQLRNILTEYLVDHGTYPPAYGYLDRDAVEFMRQQGTDIALLQIGALNQLQTTGTSLFQPRPLYTRPWMAYVGQHNNLDLYDPFSIAFDTDRDGDISRLEYAPFGSLDDSAQNFSFPTALYDPNNVAGVLQGDLERQFDSQGLRPILYFPINKRQFRKVAAEWLRNDRADPRPNDSALVNGTLMAQRFPPPSYDAYVLISVGPTANTWKLITDFKDSRDPKVWNRLDPGNYAPAYYYHVLGMAAYFMATRDAENYGQGPEGDGELDFEFRARTRRGQVESGTKLSPPPGRNSNDLPAPGWRKNAGPNIFVGEG